MRPLLPNLLSNKRKSPSSQHDTNNKNALLVALYSMLLVVGGSMHLYCLIYHELDLSITRSEHARNRTPNTYRKDWSEYNERVSERMFYRMYRMKRPCFNLLCQKIEKAVGRDVFKSESYIKELRQQGYSTPKSRMYHCACTSIGDYIQGELKVALTLRFLAGASYLDLFMAYQVQANYILTIVQEVKRDWICHPKVLPMNFYEDVLYNPSRMQQIRSEFGISSDSILSGCIGAIDGWLVKIRCPTLEEVINPGKYMCRKGFFALNVQAIVDKKKDIVVIYWRKGMHT